MRLQLTSKTLLCGLVILSSSLLGQQTTAPAPRPAAGSAASAVSPQRAFLNQYCVTCHNEKTKTAKLSLDTMDVAHVGEDAEAWEKVVKKLRAGMMPPTGARRPDRPEIQTFTSWLENELDRTAVSKPNPGRSEYGNAIRDLLDLEIDVTALLPADDSSYGFDNIASALGMSPALMERYISASGKISRMAVGDPTTVSSAKTYATPVDLTQTAHIDGLPFGSRGGVVIRHFFPLDGDYTIAVAMSKSGLQAAAIGGGEQLEISVDGERVKLIDLKAGAAEADAGSSDAASERITLHVSAGTHSIGATFAARSYAPSEDTLQPYLRSVMPGNVWRVPPHVGAVTVTGPLHPTGVGNTPSRRRIFTCRPERPEKEQACAQEILANLARRAFRRPPSEADLDGLMTFYQSGRREGGFDAGIEAGLQRILASPNFIFRFESEPSRAGESYRISDLELASRMAFFLWSSLPDDELLAVATRGKLRTADELEKQVRRMLADPRSQELARNFAAQWLYLRNLQSIVPAMEEFPDFDDNLRQSMRRETELFFYSIVSEDRNVVDLLTADYTFLNDRLARHYDIPGIYGSQFRRVTLAPDHPRRGLLGQGSILTVTSLATRTSPVLRGKWILENILGTPPPEPPPNVPALQEAPKQSPDKGMENVEVPSVRQRMEQHRVNAACVSCHKVMDPIGFALENFDAVGRWRTKDGRHAVDPAGELVDGMKVNGPASLRQALLRDSDLFTRTVTEKLLTFGLGRGVEYYDMPVIRAIVRDAGRNGNHFSSLIIGIVKSAPFQMKAVQRNAVAQN
jgi:cytochrome c551/c552